jgi:RNA polymerase sigma-70 factor (ECF subfamily)
VLYSNSTLPVHTSDLSLARACLHGDPDALRALDALLSRTVPLAVARWRGESIGSDELHQVLRVKLLVATATAPPKLAEYAGRGELRHWLRLVAVRALIDLQRRRHLELPLEADELGALPSAAEDPALAAARSRYREHFQASFCQAVSSLTPRERNLLRQHFLGQLTLDQLAALYRVHRVTIARWLAQARQTLLRRTRARLGERLSMAEITVESVVHMIRSELAASIQRIFSSQPSG